MFQKAAKYRGVACSKLSHTPACCHFNLVYSLISLLFFWLENIGHLLRISQNIKYGILLDFRDSFSGLLQLLVLGVRQKICFTLFQVVEAGCLASGELFIAKCETDSFL